MNWNYSVPVVCLVFHQGSYLFLICWLFILYWKVQPPWRNSLNAKLYICTPPLPFIFLSDHLLHMYWFENIFQISFSAVLICASLPRRDYICCHAHALWGCVLFFNNCFTRVNRRLVNSFSYGNRIFWSREM